MTAPTDRGPAPVGPSTPAGPADGMTATCVFAVRRGGDPGSLAGRSGHTGGGPLRLLPLAGSLRAVVQSVPAADFTQEALRRRLSDPVALERCARGHHDVVVAAAADGPVVPLPLATLFTDDRRAAEALDHQRQLFLGTLDRLAGRAEWSVKVHLGRSAGTAPAPAASRTAGTARAAAPGAGAAYLSRVRGRERDRQSWQDAALHVAQRVHDTAAALAVAAVRRRPHGPEVTGRDRHQVLNAAFLVDNARSAELAAAVHALRGSFTGLEVHIDVTGPWVPYSFTGGVHP
ncbi:GvpL/GvpF family gas vesicle protein [Actinacidiphila sp. bgisy145]|uniref:GvpL/GvpF family gas vesicle protein n=1 Tax=Actinacidiphila sp. bgisy145 TaxID=3413792 RepID=UPI003EC0D038